ncbi:MAG: DUF1036 domain-containing protein [Rhizomicrobium sp.]
MVAHPARACQVPLKEPLNTGKYFVYARSSLAHSGVSRAWGGDHQLCAKDANFAMRAPANSISCPSDDMFPLHSQR